MKPIFPWPGGKRKLAGKIIPLFPPHRCYCEPFCGGAAIFFMKPKSPVEVLNDINGDLINVYRCVKHHFIELSKQFDWVLSSREEFEQRLIQHPNTLTDIQRAAKFIYMQKNAFGGKVFGQNYGTATTAPPKFNIDALKEALQSAHQRLLRTYIEHLSWQSIIKKYDREHTLFYCDPPYWKLSGYGVDFGFENYRELARLASSIKGKMVISLNKHPDLVQLFSTFRIIESDYKYSCGKKPSAGTEMIICNFDPLCRWTYTVRKLLIFCAVLQVFSSAIIGFFYFINQ